MHSQQSRTRNVPQILEMLPSFIEVQSQSINELETSSPTGSMILTANARAKQMTMRSRSFWFAKKSPL